MALKIPECNVRIRALWHAEQNTRPGISERKWALEHKIDATKFNYWLKDTQPDLSGLKQLEAAFGVPWEWILLGDEGLVAMERHRKLRSYLPATSTVPPVKEPVKGRERRRASGK